MSDVHLRLLKPDDWQLLRTMRIRATMLHPTLFYDTAQTATNHPPSHWQNLLTGESNKFWGLFDGNKCVGTTGTVTVVADASGETGMIAYNFIEPEHRGKGLSALFFKAGLAHAINYRKWKKLITDHRDGNDLSRKSIIKSGFQQTERVMIDWPDGSRGYEVRYELDLEKLRE